MKLENFSRNYGLDVLRVLAIYMVIQIHTGEFYYIAKNGSVLPGPDPYWVGWYNSLFRSCVPLFIMISGYFLFPVKDVNTFYTKRLKRVAIPFILWCTLYAFYQFFTGQANLQTVLLDILKIPVNYGTEIGHLWYVYMLIGINLLKMKTAMKLSMRAYGKGSRKIKITGMQR